MKRSLMAASSVLIFTLALLAQQDKTDMTRKIVNRVTPRYPAMARVMNLRGRESGSRGAAQWDG
jgi:hypothetical protein